MAEPTTFLDCFFVFGVDFVVMFQSRFGIVHQQRMYLSETNVVTGASNRDEVGRKLIDAARSGNESQQGSLMKYTLSGGPHMIEQQFHLQIERIKVDKIFVQIGQDDTFFFNVQ